MLDVGTGTGILALAVAAALGEDGKVCGVDLSQGMLDQARSKALARGLANRIEFRRMDAEALEFADGTFDAVLSMYALRHFPRPNVALGEMLRVLRPRGRLVVAVGSGAPRWSREGLLSALRRLGDMALALSGRQLRACDYLEHLVQQHLPEPREPEEAEWTHGRSHFGGSIPQMVREAGFTRVHTQWTGQRAVIDSPEDFWDLQVTFSSLARKRTAAAAPPEREALRERCLAAARRVQSRKGTLIYPTGALFVVAERPGH